MADATDTATTTTDKTAAADTTTTTAAATTAATAADTTKTATVLDTKAADTTVATTTTAKPQSWPDDWRQKLAGDDAKVLKRLERFTDPSGLLKSYQALETKLSSGEMKSTLGENPTPEEVTQYRKDNGIPDKAEGYLDKLPDGVVIGEADKPLATMFVQQMHEQNADPKIVHAALQSFYKVQEKAQSDLAEQDATRATETEESLRVELGGNYRRELNMLTNYLSTLDPDLSEALQGARLANGNAMFGDMKAIKWVMDIVRQINPASTVVPNAGAEAGKSIDAEIAQWQAKMGDYNSDYWKGANAEANQKRYRDLLTVKEQMKART